MRSYPVPNQTEALAALVDVSTEGDGLQARRFLDSSAHIGFLKAFKAWSRRRQIRVAQDRSNEYQQPAMVGFLGAGHYSRHEMQELSGSKPQ